MKELSNKNNPQRLEDLFRTQMEAAEATPSGRVWERVEQGLDLKVAGYYKKRVSWYQALAAACVVMVVCAALYLYYEVNTRPQVGQQVANSPQTKTNPTITQNNTISAIPESSLLNNTHSQLATPPQTAATVKPGLAATLPLAENIAKNSVAGNLPANQQNVNTPEPKPIAATRAKGNHPAQKQFSAAPQNYNLAAGKKASPDGNVIDWQEAKNHAVLSENKNDIFRLEPLKPLNIWLGLSRVVPAADSLRIPRAITTTPPMLTSTPAALPEAEEIKTARWSFSAKYAPQYFNQNIALAQVSAPQYLTAPNHGNFNAAPAATVNAADYIQALNEYDRHAASGYSYNTAATVGYTLNEHWSLETGLLFTQNVAISQSSYVFNNSYLTSRYNNADPGANFKDFTNMAQAAALPTTALVASLAGQQHLGNATVIKTPTFETEYRYRSVGIPVKLNYQTNQRKSFYFASVGLLTNLLVQANIISESSQVPDIQFGNNPASPFRAWQFATVLSAGKGFRLSKAINVKAGLEGTQYLTSIAAHPENLNSKQRKPYTIGVAFSSSYTLGQ